MHITIISDCQDKNASARVETRTASLMMCPTVFLGVQDDKEASGNIIDILDAYGDSQAMVLVNVAPRSGVAKKWENGTPFGSFRYKNITVVATIDGYTLSMVKKFALADTVRVYDVPTTLNAVHEQEHITDTDVQRITKTQFRSFEFLPHVASWIHGKRDIPHTDMSIQDVADIPHTIWWIDNFGNAKTSMLPEDIHFKPGEIITTSVGNIRCQDRLKDVPNAESALVIGSSGIENNRLIEIVAQGDSAQQNLSLSVGMSLLP